MVKGEDGKFHYSRDRHDYRQVDKVAIDGGRAYTRLIGDISDIERKLFKVKDGEFVEVEDDSKVE